MVEELAQHLPELAGPCMAVKGLKYKREWEVWGRREAQLQSGDEWTFNVGKPHEGLILVGGELGPIVSSIIFGADDFVREKLKKKAGKLGGYLRTFVSVPKQAAKAYHAERHGAQKHSAPKSTVFLKSIRSGAYGGSSDDCGRCRKSCRIGAPRRDYRRSRSGMGASLLELRPWWP